MNRDLAGTDLSHLAVLSTTEYVPWLSSGGTDKVAWEVARRLAARGARVALVAGTPAGSDAPESEEIDGVRVVSTPTVDVGRLLGLELAVPRGARSALRRERTAGSVVLANGLHFPLTWLAARAAVQAGLPLVTSCHIGAYLTESRVLAAGIGLYERAAARRLLDRSSRVIAVSSSVADHIVPLTRSTVEVIPNGVDIERFRRAGVGGAREPHVVFVGRLIENKGPRSVVEALTILNRQGVRVDGTFVGDGPQRADLESLVHERGLAGQISFVGHSDRVEDWLDESSILVRPSATEGMPLAILEALAAGAAVIASDVPGSRELLRPSDAGLLFPRGDDSALASAIELLVRDTERRNELQQNGARLADQLSWDHTAAAYARTIEAARTGR